MIKGNLIKKRDKEGIDDPVFNHFEGQEREKKNYVSKIEAKTIVNVRWFDGYLEVFECSQVRQGGQILWMRLANGQNRTIPLWGNVRWFSTNPESHATNEPS